MNTPAPTSFAKAALVVAALVGTSPVGHATPEPQDKVILSIEGQIKGGQRIDFRRSDLEKLGIMTMRTTTPWHTGPQDFDGVPLDTLMKAVGANGQKANVLALNKYRTEIPFSDFAAHKPILALKREGQYMSVRDKGPLFVIYPFDSKAELKSEQYYSRAAWQVRSITIE
jgi:hypothetical protein